MFNVLFFIYFFFPLPHHAAWGISVLWTRQWRPGILITRPPGNSLVYFFKKSIKCHFSSVGHLPLLKPQGSLMAGGPWPGRVLFTRSQTPTSHCVVCPLVECPLKASLVLNKSPLSKHSLSSYPEPGSWFVTDRKRNKIVLPTSWRLSHNLVVSIHV